MPLPSFAQQTNGISSADAADVNALYTEVEKIARAVPHADYSQTRTLTGTLTLSDSDLPVQYLDPGGSDRDVTLPAEASSTNGAFWIANTADAAETLTVKDDGGNTIDTVAQDEAKFFFCNGVSWRALSGGGGASAGLTNNNISPTTSDVSASVANRYFADISGLTANRNFVLPTPAIGDEIELVITTGDDTYALIVIGDTGITIDGGSAATEWSRLFISEENVRLIATSTTNWQIVHDGRIGSKARITNSSAQSIANATTTTITLDEVVFNVGDIADGANNRIVARRAGLYLLFGAMQFKALSAARSIVSIRVDGTVVSRQEVYASSSNPALAPNTPVYLSAGQVVTLTAYQNSGSSKDTEVGTILPNLSALETF